jgi:excisionase family DNA binding protein
MGQLVGLVEVAQYLGLESRSPKRPGNRVWELLRAGRLKGLPHVRIGRTYRFNMAEVEAWVRRQAGATSNGFARSR